MKRSISSYMLLFSLIFLNFQCDRNENLTLNECDTPSIIDSLSYETTASDGYSIVTADIDNDCLNLSISASGCDGSSWQTALIDSEEVSESLPPQRYLRLMLVNTEVCLAVISEQEPFDISNLMVAGQNEIQLHIEGFPIPVIYSY